jgi:hypothetical protein
VRNALCIGRHYRALIVQIVVLAVGAHYPQDRDALGYFDTEFAARRLVTFHFVDERMLGERLLQRFGADTVQVLAYGTDAFLFQHGGYFLFRDEAGIYRVFDNQLHITAHLTRRLPVESGNGHYQVGKDEQQDDRK